MAREQNTNSMAHPARCPDTQKQRPTGSINYGPIYVSTAIYGILNRPLLKRIMHATTLGLLNIQHASRRGRNTTSLAARLLDDLQRHKGHLALLNVAKPFFFSSVPRTMITYIMREARALEPITRMFEEIYNNTPALLSLHGRELPIHPKQGMKEGCPLSPTLFLLYYYILLRETLARHLKPITVFSLMTLLCHSTCVAHGAELQPH